MTQNEKSLLAEQARQFEQEKKDLAAKARSFVRIHGSGYVSENGWFINWSKLADDLYNELTK